MAINALTSLGNTERSGDNSRADVRQALAQASRATGVDFAYLVAEASVETSLNPNAKAKTSSAAGLFQFIESTWEGMVERHGAKVGLGKEAAALAKGDLSADERRRIMDLRFDPKIAARMGAEFAAENRDHLQAKLGREPEDADLYLAHFLGPGGASKFLQRHEASPDAAAADAFPAAARANKSIFYQGDRARSYDEIRERFSAKLAARADDLDDVPGSFPVPGVLIPGPSIRVVSSVPSRPAAIEKPAERTGTEGPPQSHGDPWLSTLITAQLSRNSSLMRVGDSSQANSAETFRSLTG
jgi:hypothetical protein